MQKTSEYKETIKKKDDEDDSEEEERVKSDKLMNLIYNDGAYWAFEGRNKHSSKFNIIDNHIWYITKFMPEVKRRDVNL